MAHVHVGDRLQRRVVRVLVDQAARLDHAARRDEVALDPPDEEVPDEADHADAQRDPERVVEERADRPGDAVVRHPRVEGAGDEPDDEREHEPAPRLEEREPVALPYEQNALARGEQRVVLRGLGVGRAHPAAPDSPTRARTVRANERSQAADAARSSSAISIFPIFSIAAMARCDFSRSGSPISS